MKKTILILLLLTTLNIRGNVVLKNIQYLNKDAYQTAYVLKNTLRLGLAYYHLHVNIIIDTLGRKVSGDIITKGKTEQVNDSTFAIYLYKVSDMDSLIINTFHELTHVNQLAKKELFVFEDHFLYKNTKFKKSVYFSAPWEEEAYLMQEVLFLKFKIVIYKNDRNKIEKKCKNMLSNI